MIDPEYTNMKEYQEDLSLLGVIKNHWAVISGTTLACLFTGIAGFLFTIDAIFIKNDPLKAAIIITVWLAVYSVAGMICWGFVTNNKKNILARIVRPWQVYEEIETNNDTV